ncbi:restriction endonuclease subunit S [Aerococcus viridans]
MYKKKKLGDLVDIGSSKRVYAQEYVDEGVPFYRSKEIIEKAQGREISNPLYISLESFEELRNKHGAPKNGDLLLTSVGTLGIPYIVRDEEFYFKDGNLTWFNNFQNLDNMYLYYWFNSTFGKAEINKRLIGSTQKALTITNLKEFEIYLPDNYIQKKIVNILSSFDDKIEINNAIIANLEEQAQAIFKSWFVDFEPFLDEGFVDSEVGLIPKGFSVVRLKEVSTRRNGYSYKSKELNELSDTNMITLKNFNRNGGIDFSDTKPIDETERMKEFHYLNSGDILIACTDLTQNAEVLGRTISYFENEEFDKEVYSMDLVKIEPNNIEDQMYIYYYLNSFVFKSFAEGVATGTTVLHLPKKSIDEFKMVYPSSKLVNEFSNLVKPMLLKQNKLTLENKKLEEVRDALLPKLMSGEIRVGEAVESK